MVARTTPAVQLTGFGWYLRDGTAMNGIALMPVASDNLKSLVTLWATGSDLQDYARVSSTDWSATTMRAADRCTSTVWPRPNGTFHLTEVSVYRSPVTGAG